MNKLYILVGVPASGKSTICKELEKDGVIIYATDKIRGKLFGDENLQYTEEWLEENGYKGSNDPFEKYQFANKLIYDMFYDKINYSLQRGYSVAADATNVSATARKYVIDNCGEFADEIHCIVMATPLETCIERNQKRDRTLELKDIIRIAGNYQEPTLEEGFTSIRFINDKSLIDYGVAINKTGGDSSIG